MKPNSLAAADLAHHFHPFTDLTALRQNGVRMVHSAKGVHIRDADGTKYLDAMSGLWCVNIGYGRQELVDAATTQMSELPYYNTFFQTTTQPAAELTTLLSELTPPHLNSFFLASSGSEANDTIVRMLRTYWQLRGRPEKMGFISRIGSYHGSTMICASLGGMDYMHRQGGLPLPGFHHVAPPYWWRDGGDLDPLEFGLRAARAIEDKILEVGADHIAAVIGEPVMAGIGVIDPPATYWPEVERICRKHDVLLIADEVINGFGRTGAWFAHTHEGIKPDAMTMAKGLSSGYQPISAAAFSDQIMEVFANSGEAINHGFTYSGHPVAAAVAVANLRILRDEGIIERVASITAPYFMARLAELREHPLVGDTRGRGLLAGVELSPDKARRAPFAPIGKAAKLASAACLARGLITRPLNDTLALCPPLIISEAEIDELFDKLRGGLDDAAAMLAREGGI